MENGVDIQHRTKKIAVMYDEGSLVEAGEFDKIEAMTKEAVEIVKEVRG